MRKLFGLVALLVSVMMASTSVVAQTPAADFSEVDIEAVAETALGADLDALMTGMEEPMADEALPAVFSNATYVDPETAGSEDLVLPAEDLEFADGSVAYNVDYAPEAQGMVIGFSSLNYIFVDAEITEDDMDDFIEGASEGMEEDTSGAEMAVEEVEINGVTGALISYELEEDGIISIVQMVALPVGNTMVISMVVAASDDLSLDSGTVLTDAESLALAGVDHLGIVAEDAQ
jgi:hypothetical protein